MIVALEGGEYVGKSSVAQALKQQYGYTIRREPGVFELRKFIKEELIPKKYPKHVMALAYALDRAISYHKTPPGSGVTVTDRSVISSLVMQSEGDGARLTENTIINLHVPFPDVVVWLRATESTLESRHKKRAKQGTDLYDEDYLHWNNQYSRMMPVLQRLLPSIIFIEFWTDDKTPEQVAGEIHERLVSMK